MVRVYVTVVAVLALSVWCTQATPRACTWDDVEYCEMVLSNYTGDPRNWEEDPETKGILYCDFIRIRLLCLESLVFECDTSRATDEMPININTWITMIAPRLEMLVDLGLCSEQPRNPNYINYNDPCDEFYAYKRCMGQLSDYLKTRFAMTCVAMLKAAPCFKGEREKCGIIDEDMPVGGMNPYGIMANTGHCKLYWNPSYYADQEAWRIKNGFDYFTYF